MTKKIRISLCTSVFFLSSQFALANDAWLGRFSASSGFYDDTKKFTIETLAEVAKQIPVDPKHLAADPLNMDVLVVEKIATNGATNTFYDRFGKQEGNQAFAHADSLEKVKNVIRHEVTHYVLAHVYKKPVPRWYDEGRAMVQESQKQRDMYFEKASGGKMLPSDFMKVVDMRTLGAAHESFYERSHALVSFLRSQLPEADREKNVLEFAMLAATDGTEAALKKFFPKIKSGKALDEAYVEYVTWED